MKSFHITVVADKWPFETTVKATDWPAAVARGVRDWKKRFKGSRTQTLSIRVVKGI